MVHVALLVYAESSDQRGRRSGSEVTSDATHRCARPAFSRTVYRDDGRPRGGECSGPSVASLRETPASHAQCPPPFNRENGRLALTSCGESARRDRRCRERTTSSACG